ncbi:hypothetical protein LZC95_47100 [Pendulispora brunnea]|uniref:PLC-like phosphodiesterase n=1 Tax=Pendulispora brunnea TaxID=2905690 RepID=A0ABZ2K5N4_9BACT
MAGCYLPVTVIETHDEHPPKDTPSSSAPLRTCNRVDCTRRYDQITQLATHNAFAWADDGPVHYKKPNQMYPVWKQLERGVRGLGLRPSPHFTATDSDPNDVYVTHNADLRGALGQEPLVNVLNQVRAFLENNPSEVVTIFAESSVSPEAVAHTFEKAGLIDYLYTHTSGTPWPTLSAMVVANQRLVVFNDSQDSNRPTWQHYLWDFVVDTDFNVTNSDQFSCGFYRGKPSNDLYFVNHFVYKDDAGILMPDPALATRANQESFVFERAKDCWHQTKRVPNVIYIDWFGLGGALDAVDALNELPRDTP